MVGFDTGEKSLSDEYNGKGDSTEERKSYYHANPLDDEDFDTDDYVFDIPNPKF